MGHPDGGLCPGNVSLLLGRSSDLGNHWDTTLVRDARGIQGDDIESNRPFTALAVDTTSASDDIIYAAWRQDHNVAQVPRPAQPMVAVSTDGGRHFAAPVSAVGQAFQNADLRQQTISATTTTLAPATPTTAPAVAPPPPDTVTNFGGGNPSVTVNGKSTIYVVWPSWTVNIAPRPEPGILLLPLHRSRQDLRGVPDRPVQTGEPGRQHLQAHLEPPGGPQGSLHLIYEVRDPDIAAHVDTVYRRSTDGGRTWSDPRSLADDDPKQLYSHLIPNIAVAPDGRLDAVWWDTRSDPGIRGADVYQASSTDNGLTWSKNLRVTDQTVDRKLGVFGNNFDISAPPGGGLGQCSDRCRLGRHPQLRRRRVAQSWLRGRRTGHVQRRPPVQDAVHRGVEGDEGGARRCGRAVGRRCGHAFRRPGCPGSSWRRPEGRPHLRPPSSPFCAGRLSLGLTAAL